MPLRHYHTLLIVMTIAVLLRLQHNAHAESAPSVTSESSTPEVTRLIEQANNVNLAATQRRDAVKQLSNMGPRTEQEVSKIADLVAAEDEWLRISAAEAIATVGRDTRSGAVALSRASRKALQELQAEHVETRLFASLMLVRVGQALSIIALSDEDLSILIRALENDKESRVRKHTAIVLGNLGAEARAHVAHLVNRVLLDEEERVRGASKDAIIRILQDVRDRLISQNPVDLRMEMLVRSLREGNGEKRRIAVARMPRMAKDSKEAQIAVTAVASLLGDSNPHVRKGCAECLGKIGNSLYSSQYLRFGVKGEKSAIRESREAILGLTMSSIDDDVAVRKASVGALGVLAGVANRVHTNAHPGSKPWAASHTDLQNILRALSKVVAKDGHPGVKVAAFTAISSVDPLPLALSRFLFETVLLEDDTEVIERADEALAKIQIRNVDAIPILTKMLAHERPGPRLRAVLKLGDMAKDARGTIAALTPLLEDPVPEIRRVTALAIRRIRSASAASGQAKLMSELRSPLQMERTHAVVELGKVRPVSRQVVQALANALADPDPRVRESAALTILDITEDVGEKGHPFIPALVEALGDASRWPREYAAQALLRIGERSTDPVCAALKSRDSKVRAGAVAILGRMGPKAESALVHLMLLSAEDADPLIRQAATKAAHSIEMSLRDPGK